jgi:TatD DNase family protein
MNSLINFSSSPYWIDMHAHLDRLEHSPEEAIRIAEEQNVKKIITIGTEPQDLELVLSLSEKFYPKVFCTLGVHPHEGALFTDETEKFIRTHAQRKEVVAIGEIGLDYYYQNSSIEDQKVSFRRQLQMAADLNLPVEIHTRDAEKDTIEILNEFRGQVRGLIHCFTGTQWLAEKSLDLGFNISISGVATFKNASSLRQTVEYIPLDRIHVETDAPFLAPVPHRGKKNTPAFMVHTAEVVAKLKKISTEKLAEISTKNAFQLMTKIVE